MTVVIYVFAAIGFGVSLYMGWAIVSWLRSERW